MHSCGKPSRGSYNQGCRCYMCRVANSEYERARREGAEPAMVGAAKTRNARRRVEDWQRRGIGLREIEFWTGVSRSSLRTLVRGKHPNCNGLPKRMSRANHEAIMSTHIPEHAPGALVDSRVTLRYMDIMREAGLSYAEMARRAGVSRSTIYKLAEQRPERVTQQTATRIGNASKPFTRGMFPKLRTGVPS